MGEIASIFQVKEYSPCIAIEICEFQMKINFSFEQDITKHIQNDDEPPRLNDIPKIYKLKNSNDIESMSNHLTTFENSGIYNMYIFVKFNLDNY